MHIKTKTIDAIKFAGTKSKLAEYLGITRQSITYWGALLPQTSSQKLYILTDGTVGTKIDSNEDDKRANTEA